MTEELPGLPADLTSALVPPSASGDSAWGTLREIGLMPWIRYLPGAVRSMLSRREPVGGLPLPAHAAPGEAAEVDYNDSHPVSRVDHTPVGGPQVVEADAAVQAREPEPLSDLLADMAHELEADDVAGAQAATGEHATAEAAAEALPADGASVSAAVPEAAVAEAGAAEAGADVAEAGL